MNNGSGRHPPDFSVFDNLPLCLRRVLCYAPRSYAAHTVVDAYVRRKETDPQAYADRMVIKLRLKYPGWDMPE